MGKHFIGGFEVGEALGSGAQGDVYSAYDSILDRRVALKVFKPNTEDGENKRAMREARSLARLQHPNIVTLFGITRQGGARVLIMEYTEGTALSKKLEDGPLPVAECESVIRQMASALQYAADRGLMHGDIKPSNILICDDGTVKLLDFGLATIIEKDDPLATVEPGTASKCRFEGTIGYTAPERIMGYAADIRSDIFSVGAVLYEMITGMPAFAQPNQAATLNKILNEHPARLSVRHDGVALWCQQLIDAVLAKDPKSRLNSMAQILNFLPEPGVPIATPGKEQPQGRSLAQLVLGKIGQASAQAILFLAALAMSGSSSPGLLQTQNVPVSVLIDEGIDRLLNFHDAGAITGAQTAFGKIVETDPSHSAGNAGLALALIRQYTSQEADPATLRRATSLAEQAFKADPQLALANVAAAWAAEFNEDFDRAERLYNLADNLNPGDPFVLEGRARSLSKNQKFIEAEAVLRKALALHPERRVFYDDLGKLLSVRGKHIEAEKVLRVGLKLYPDNVSGYASLSHVLFMQGRVQEAIQTAQVGLQVRPDATLYNNLGTYLFFEGLYEQSAKAFERTLELGGNTHELLYWANLADAYRWTPGKQNEAKSAYRQAISFLLKKQATRPDHTGINTRMALYAAKAGDHHLARDNLARLRISELKEASDLYRITVVFEILGDRSAALRTLELAIDAGYGTWEIANDPELANLRQDREYHLTINDI